MNQPVDLTNLHSMTDNDTEMEKALFEEFCISFEKGIGELKGSTDSATSEAWRRAAHGLKGIALNLGAETLGHICKEAQDKPEIEAKAKQELLGRIEAEYAQVKAYLKQVA